MKVLLSSLFLIASVLLILRRGLVCNSISRKVLSVLRMHNAGLNISVASNERMWYHHYSDLGSSLSLEWSDGAVANSSLHGAVICARGLGGFANFMFGLVSSYAISVLLDKPLYFDVNINFDRFFYVLSTNHEVIQRIANQSAEDSFYGINSGCFHRKHSFSRRLCNEDIHSIFPNHTIRIATNCPLFAWILGNEDNYKKFVRLGFLPNELFNSSDISVHGFRLMSYILNHFIVFNSDIIDAVMRRKSEWKDRKSVGMHIRKGKSNALRDREFLYYEDAANFAKCSVFNQLSHPIVYVASDSSVMKKRIEYYNASFTVLSSSIRASHSAYWILKKGSNKVGEVLTDILSVASCDYVIGTKHSTLSLLTAAFHGDVPYLVGKNESCSHSSIVNYFYVLFNTIKSIPCILFHSTTC